jgi:hypothetical protein
MRKPLAECKTLKDAQAWVGHRVEMRDHVGDDWCITIIRDVQLSGKGTPHERITFVEDGAALYLRVGGYSDSNGDWAVREITDVPTVSQVYLILMLEDKHVCTCDLMQLIRSGCVCGAFKEECHDRS